MFDIGIWEIILILAIALVIIGPQRLPAMAMQLGKVMHNIRRIQRTVYQEFRKEFNELQQTLPVKKEDLEDIKDAAHTIHQEADNIHTLIEETPTRKNTRNQSRNNTNTSTNTE